MARNPDTDQHPLTARLLCFSELGRAELDQWRNLQHAHEDYRSALFSPEFAELVSLHRKDARIGMIYDGERVIAVFPVHLRPDRLARPLGAPFADYAGPIVTSDFPLSMKELLQQCGIAAYGCDAVVDPWRHFKLSRRSAEPADSHVIRLGEASPSDYIESRRAAHPKRFKNFRRLKNQIERDVGQTRFEWGHPSDAALDAIMALKSAQFKQTGLVDLTSATLARELLDAVAASEYSFATSLWIGEKLASAHFGVRIGSFFHPWIAVFDPELSAYSPGILLINDAISHMPEMGIETYDLASGHDHYKKYFSNASRPVQSVFETGRGIRAGRQALNRAIWAMLGANATRSPVGRLRRRMDHIAESESLTLGRIREFGHAVLERGIRRKGS